MALSRKRAPVVQSLELNRVIIKIYDDINEIINSVNQGDTSVQKTATEGKPGDIRVIKDSGGLYYVEARTDEGWVQSTSDTTNFPSGYKFREND